jgi:DNA (cytosine-5)-methyltransferase 1
MPGRVLTIGSLFSGIQTGGLDLGLERAGHRVVWQVEIDPFCRAVLAKHWPDVPRYEDVHDVGAHNLEPVDLVCGGFPCQPVSVAGKQLAREDERWLWPEFARILRELRPRFVLLENVPGLLVHGMGDVLGDLADLGYDAEWESIPAAAVGAPHLRYRVFVVAYAGGIRRDFAGTEQPLSRAWLARETRVANPNGERREELDATALPSRSRFDSWRLVADEGAWSAEPDVDRVAHGVPARVDRLRALGNAVVPQVAEWIGSRLALEPRR